MMKKLISIIVPFFNAEKTLKRCIDSILRQTYHNYEVILVDNASTDKSKEIVLSYVKRHKNMHYFEIKERNVSLARNMGLTKARGELITFVDADDMIDKNFLKIMGEKIINRDLVICKYTRRINKLGQIDDWAHAIDKDEIVKQILDNREIKGYIWNKMFWKNIIDEHEIVFNEKLRIGEDVDFVYNYVKYCQDIVFVNSILYYYNFNSNCTVNKVVNYKYALESWEHLFELYQSDKRTIDSLNLICYFYLKKYYEVKYYDKEFKISKKINFGGNNLFKYKIKLFFYKYFIGIIIMLKKLRMMVMR